MRTATALSLIKEQANRVWSDAVAVTAMTRDALFDRPLSYYPRVAQAPATAGGHAGPEAVLPDGQIISQIDTATRDWDVLKASDIDGAIKIAREGLDEVKAQTEYQDNKATRLLTVTSFLSALSGALLVRFLDSYPIRETFEAGWCGRVLIMLSYIVFAVFALSSLSGAIIIFHGTRTRFRYPAPVAASSNGEFPMSLIFWGGIIRSTPADWAGAFVRKVNGVPAVRDDLSGRHLAGLIRETYLIAAKTADKLRVLEIAQKALACSLQCLLLWLVLLGVVAMAIPSTKPDPKPVETHLIGRISCSLKSQAIDHMRADAKVLTGVDAQNAAARVVCTEGSR
jgi:hypothetical protein